MKILIGFILYIIFIKSIKFSINVKFSSAIASKEIDNNNILIKGTNIAIVVISRFFVFLDVLSVYLLYNSKYWKEIPFHEYIKDFSWILWAFIVFNIIGLIAKKSEISRKIW